MMYKWSAFSILLILLLTACSGKPSWDVEVTKEPIFIKEKPSTIEIEVLENSKPVTGLDITGEFSMVEMDHGKVEVDLAEIADGKYAGTVQFPMAGKWEAVFSLGEDLEKVVELNIEETGGVASINGEWITEEDIEFYRFINHLHIEMARETDRQKYTGAELEEAMTYWDTQEEMTTNQNTLISQIIRLRSMAMLGEEKGHQATKTEINSELEKVRSQYGNSETAQQLIREFGEEKFWNYQEAQYAKIVLTQKVQADIIELVKKDSPQATEQEIQFTAEKKYEELLVSQVDSLEIILL